MIVGRLSELPPSEQAEMTQPQIGYANLIRHDEPACVLSAP